MLQPTASSAALTSAGWRSNAKLLTRDRAFPIVFHTGFLATTGHPRRE
jgi:hypothetical protein